jgi:dTMP kinase
MRINTEKGKFIVFEGLDGSGQTTQANLLTKWIMEKRQQFAYYTKEPTDGPLGSMLRLFLSKRLYCAPSNGNATTPRRPDETTMALCFAADRADHLYNEILPKLRDTVHVIADRYYHSSLAYQSVDAELPWIREINKNILRPDLTLFLDVPPPICMKRMQAQRWHVELYEDLDNLEKVRKNFLLTLEKSRAEGERIEIISGHQSPKDVHRDIVQAVKSYFRTVLMNERHVIPTKEVIGKGQLELLNETEPLSEPEIAACQY